MLLPPVLGSPGGIRLKLRMVSCLPGPHGHEVAVLQSFRPMKSGSRTPQNGVAAS